MRETQPKKKRYLALWSGGLDSTAMIYRQLDAGHIVKAVSCQLRNNDDQTRQEIEARKKLAALFTADFPKTFSCWTDDQTTIEHESEASTFVRGPGRLILQQVPLWLFTALYAGDSEVDAVLAGYVSGDCALEFWQDIQRAWKGFSGLVDGKQPPLEFPLAFVGKAELYRGLPQKYREALWFCGEPNGDKPCGNCTDCRRHAIAVAEAEMSDRQIVQRLKIDEPTSAVPPDADARFFCNFSCSHFPCHSGLPHATFNCLFCYCPLYTQEKCPGKPRTIEVAGKKVRDCSGCAWPHKPENYGKMLRRLKARNK